MESTLLLIGLFFCHFLADYTWLSTNLMLDAKRFGKPLIPIWYHASVHALLMAVFLRICYGFPADYFNWNTKMDIIEYVILLQLTTHFLIDVWKGRMNGWFPSLQSPANKWHWVIFGFDQFLHAVVIILMVYFVSK